MEPTVSRVLKSENDLKNIAVSLCPHYFPVWLVVGLMAGVSAWLAVVAIHSRRVTESCTAWQRHRQVETDRCEHCGATWEVSDREAVEMIGPRDHYVIPSAVGWQVATFVSSQVRLIPSLVRCMSLFVPRSNTPVPVLFDRSISDMGLAPATRFTNPTLTDHPSSTTRKTNGITRMRNPCSDCALRCCGSGGNTRF